jgi:hypothetical protein
MNCALHVCPVKVEGRKLGLGERAREPEDIPENGECVKDAVNVESGIDYKRGVEDLVPDVATWVEFNGFAGEGKKSLRWVGDMLLEIVSIVAALGSGLQVIFECLTERGLYLLDTTVSEGGLLECKDVFVFVNLCNVSIELFISKMCNTDKVHCGDLLLYNIPGQRG